MLKSFVLKQNKDLGLRNIINSYFWYAEDIEKGFNKQVEYYSNKELGLVNDIKKDEIKGYLKDYYISLENKNKFNKFIERLKSYYPNKISNKKLLENEGINEYFNSINDLHNFIINNIIPIIKNI